MKNFKRIISLILAIMMIFSLFSISAYALRSTKDDDGHNLSYHDVDDAPPVGTFLSDGCLTIVVGVASAVVFGIGGFMLGKKKGRE